MLLAVSTLRARNPDGRMPASPETCSSRGGRIPAARLQGTQPNRLQREMESYMVSKKRIITSVAAALLAIGMATAPAMARGGGGGGGGGHGGGGFGGGFHGGGFGGGFHGGGFHGGFSGRGYR